MDKPNINIRAWQPVDKRRKVNNTRTKKDSISIANNSGVGSTNIQRGLNPPLNEVSFNEEIYYGQSNKPKYHKYYKRENNMEDDFYINEKYPNNEYHKQTYKRKKESYINIRLIKAIGTGVGAIVTGVFLGYLILNFLIGTNEQETSITTPPNDIQIINNNDNTPIVTGQIIPEQITYLIQAGVFSSLSGAEAIVEQQRNLGRLAVVKQDDSYYVYIGIASSKEQANLLKDFLTSEGVDLYAKKYVINERRFDMKDSTFTTFRDFINQGQQLVNLLSEGSIQALINSDYKIDYEGIQKIHQEFLLDIQALKTSLEEENLIVEKDLVQNMSDQVNYAIAAVNAYKKNPNSQYLWNIQELLIKYELFYEGYVKKID